MENAKGYAACFRCFLRRSLFLVGIGIAVRLTYEILYQLIFFGSGLISQIAGQS